MEANRQAVSPGLHQTSASYERTKQTESYNKSRRAGVFFRPCVVTGRRTQKEYKNNETDKKKRAKRRWKNAPHHTQGSDAPAVDRKLTFDASKVAAQTVFKHMSTGGDNLYKSKGTKRGA